MKKFINISFTIILIFSQSFLFAQKKSNYDAYEEVFQLAQNLENSGAFKEAFLEYKRYIFLQDYSEGIHQEEAYIRLSKLFEKEKNYSQALENFEIALNINSSTENKIEHITLIRRIASEINADFGNNKFLFQYKFLQTEPEEVRKLAWVTSLENQIITEKFDIFEKDFQEFIKLFPDYFSDAEITQIYDGLNKITKFKPKNPTLARFLSIIPGLGQVYAGQPLDGLNAFLLNGSLFALSSYSLGTLNFCDFILFEIAPTYRFYNGNFLNAERETIEYNRKKITGLKNCILDILK